MERVAVVGASPKEERYSYQAIKMLLEHGHNPIPIAIAVKEILGQKTYKNVLDIGESVETLTMYVGAQKQSEIIESIIVLKPSRVIFNPGAENPSQYERLNEAGIDVIEACTLVLLRTNQF